MFYILNFKTHTFTHASTIDGVLCAVIRMCECMKDLSYIEIVNAYSDDLRMDFLEFLNEFDVDIRKEIYG